MTEADRGSHWADGLSVVIPCYGSESTLRALVTALLPALGSLATAFEVILVVDGSPDDTFEIARSLQAEHPGTVRTILLRRNYGQHNALLAGLSRARFGITITMDDDLQHRPDQIGALLAPLRDPGVDLVYGVPTIEEHGTLRSFASRAVKSALALSGVPNAKDVSAFRAFRTDLRDGFAHVTDPFVSIDVVLSWTTASVVRVPVVMDERAAGRSGYTLGKLLAHAANMATGYSVLPLRLVTWLGFFVSAFGGVALVTVLVRYWSGQIEVAGFTTLVAMLGLLCGVIMLSLGILGEYLGRLHVRSMQRPTYVVRSEDVTAYLPGQAVAASFERAPEARDVVDHARALPRTSGGE